MVRDIKLLPEEKTATPSRLLFLATEEKEGATVFRREGRM